MKNQVHGLATLYVLNNTDLNEEEYNNVFHQENIVGVKLQITTSDGKIHEVDVAFLEELNWTEYIKREASEQKPTDPKA